MCVCFAWLVDVDGDLALIDPRKLVRERERERERENSKENPRMTLKLAIPVPSPSWY